MGDGVVPTDVDADAVVEILSGQIAGLALENAKLTAAFRQQAADFAKYVEDHPPE